MSQSLLLEKIRSKKARVGVIGLGYVGLPLAVLAANRGYQVTGILRSREKLVKLKDGETNVDTVDGVELKRVIAKKSLTLALLTTGILENQDIIIVCVPTPVTGDKKPDLTAMESVAHELTKANLKNRLIINESTVAPGTTRELFGSLSTYLACSPERVDPGNPDKHIGNTAKIVGGRDGLSLNLAELFYQHILDASVVAVSNLETAEMAKMVENTYRAVNIALANEFALLCEKVGIDILEVIRAASTKWSFQAHFPGIGVGGHCIPVDPYYLVDLAQKKKSSMTVVPPALQRNNDMPHALFEKVRAVYKKGMSLVVYGITYKKDVADLRESPVIEFCKYLKLASIPFGVFDPLVDPDHVRSLELVEVRKGYVDLFVVGTDHKQLAHDQKYFISEHTIVIDGRNFFVDKVGAAVWGVGRMIS